MNCSSSRCVNCGECKTDCKTEYGSLETTFEKALRIHGHVKQALKATEELAELAIELSRFAQDNRFDREKILEELTDVEIMLRQIKIIFEFTQGELISMKTLKIAKLEMLLREAELNK